MFIQISDEYAHDIIITKLQEDWLDINDDIKMISAMNRAGETNISLDKFYMVRNSIKTVLRYHMEEDLFEEWEDEAEG
jgi:hypothetical protein|tara:strand:+ start:1736 stop:1969 length:234 start_codon:yes stop_codon:yes gene_type:complete